MAERGQFHEVPRLPVATLALTNLNGNDMPIIDFAARYNPDPRIARKPGRYTLERRPDPITAQVQPAPLQVAGSAP